jgi:hypothetical protein
LQTSDAFSETQAQTVRSRSIQDGAVYALYALALAASVSTWFLAIRAPLWLDETVSFFMVKGRFSEIVSRQGWPGVPAYPVLLWIWIRTVGASEIGLRISSALAMLGAVYLLYRSARELFSWDVGVIAAAVFCLHPVINSEAIDVRPYAFAALAITSCIFILVRMRHNHSIWLGALFALSAACIVYFQFLFAVILPALAVCFFALHVADRKIFWRRAGVVVVVFALAFVPVLPGVQYMFHTSGIHVFESPPTLGALGQVLGQKRPAFLLGITFVIAALTRRVDRKSPVGAWRILLCVSLALVPILILYGVSAYTSIQIFTLRYRLVAVPGVALCWAFVVSRIESGALRLFFCIAIVAVTTYHYVRLPSSRTHNYTWKYALDFAEKNASADKAPVLICSDLPESDHMPMPAGPSVKDSALFAPLSYYPLSVPVVGLPRSVNDQAKQIGLEFLQEASARNQRFLALAYVPSYETLDWLADSAEGKYSARELGEFNGVKVVAFTPLIAKTSK